MSFRSRERRFISRSSSAIRPLSEPNLFEKHPGREPDQLRNPVGGLLQL